MTREEILAMQPGADLNAEVAEKIMGHITNKDEIFGYTERLVDPKDGNSIWSPVQLYSEDIGVIKLVVEKMIELGYEDAVNWANFGDGKYTKPEAICKAALLAVLEKQKVKETSDEILRKALGDEGVGNI
jgi:hypothetical protein